MTVELFDKPQSRTLRTEIVDILRDAIISGKLLPGQHLKENTIAAQLAKLSQIGRSINERVAEECIQVLHMSSAQSQV